jgi:uncharacterized damage-inducible protein DinB
MKTTGSIVAENGTAGQTGGRAGYALAQAMLMEFERELGTTRRFLERLPADRLTWQPHEKSMTAGELALHIAQAPAGVLKLSLAEEATAPDFNAGRPQPQTLHDVLTTLDSGAVFVRQTLPTIDDERMRQTFKVVRGERTLMSVPRVDFLRAIMLNHWYHHRGQFGVYLRLVGAIVPSSYGPSGDESPFSA